jgi:hypothetical protein
MKRASEGSMKSDHGNWNSKATGFTSKVNRGMVN